MAFRQNRFAHSSFVVGKKNSSSAGYGFPLGIKIAGSTSTRSSAIYSDDAGAALPAGSYAGFESRLLTTIAAAANTSFTGALGHYRNVAATQVAQDNASGVWAYNENSGTGSVGSSTSTLYTGLRAQIDVPSGMTIASGKYVSAIGVGYCDLGGTHTGKATILQTTPCAAGVFDYFAVFYEAGSCVAKGAKTVGTVTYLLPVVTPDGATGYISIAPWT